LFQIADFLFYGTTERKNNATDQWGRNVDFNRWIVVGGVNDLWRTIHPKNKIEKV